MNLECDTGVDTAKRFVLLTQTLLSLMEAELGDRKLINSCFKDLNKLDHKNVKITNNNEVVALIYRLQKVIRPTETLLIKNTCCFMRNVICNDVNFGASYETSVQWLLDMLQCSEQQAHNDILLALQEFVRLGKYNVKHVVQILLGDKGYFMKYFTQRDRLWSDSTSAALWCLVAVLEKGKNNTTIPRTLVSTVKSMVMNIISSQPSSFDPQSSDKILTAALRVLRTLIEQKYIEDSTDLVGEMLGVIQAFLFHGIKDYEPMKPQLLHPAAMNLPEPVHVIPKGKNLKNHRIRSKKHTPNKANVEVKNNTGSEHKGSYKQSSDSDLSDNEINNSARSHSKVRLESVHLLKALIDNSQNRELFGYWPQIVATGSNSNARVLTRSILEEPASKVKQCKLSALTELLMGARPFLIHAEDDEHVSFTTFFYTVSFMIKELHSTLSLVITTDRNAAVLIQALKCAAALIHGTPYARLEHGLITKFIRSCRCHIDHNDPTVRVATLSVFKIIASYDPVTPEIFKVLGESYDFENEEEVTPNGMKPMSIIVHECVKNISAVYMNLPVRVQSLKIIGQMAFSTGKLIFPYLETVTSKLTCVLVEKETQVVLQATRALEIMAGCLSSCDYSGVDVVLFFNMIFDKVAALTSHTQTVLREAACDCLGSIGSTMLTQLSREATIQIITILFGAVHDEESAVRAAAVRALGMLVTLRSLEEDTGFLMDVADIVCLVSTDQNLGVRVKGAWTLANLCDSLVKLRQYEDVEPVPLEIVLPKLYDVSVKGTKDNDKVKCNAVRAVGTILHLCPDRETLKNTSSGLDALITCATTGPDMKVRWNACRSLGLVLSRDPETILPATWRDDVFPALCTLVYQSPNFKVRTNAAWALSTSNLYGKYTVTIWKSIVLAFENAQHVPSYIEYPHREALVQQLCLTLSHVAACTKESDLQPLWTVFGEHVEDIFSHMKHFQETILPEKMGDLIKALAQMEKFVKSASSAEERQIARMLMNIFERPNYRDSSDDIAP